MFEIFYLSKILFTLFKFKVFNSKPTRNDLFIIKKNIVNSGPIYIKFIQWLIPFSKYYIDKKDYNIIEYFNDLYDDCPFHDLKYTNKIYKLHNNNNLEDDYDIIENIGSGSIGQTHLIKSKKDNKEYVIKIKHPPNNSILYINTICKIINYFISFPFDEILYIFKLQLDFNIEASNMISFYNFYKDNDHIIIPKLYKYSKDYIIMEHLKGQDELSDKDNSIKISLINLFLQNNIRYLNLCHGDLHPGNFSFKDNKLIVYDFGLCYVYNNKDFLNLNDDLTYLYSSLSYEDKIKKFMMAIEIFTNSKVNKKDYINFINNNKYKYILESDKNNPDSSHLWLDYIIKYKLKYTLNSFLYLINTSQLYDNYPRVDYMNTNYNFRAMDMITICDTFNIFKELKEEFSKKFIKSYKKDNHLENFDKFKKYI